MLKSDQKLRDFFRPGQSELNAVLYHAAHLLTSEKSLQLLKQIWEEENGKFTDKRVVQRPTEASK